MSRDFDGVGSCLPAVEFAIPDTCLAKSASTRACAVPPAIQAGVVDIPIIVNRPGGSPHFDGDGSCLCAQHLLVSPVIASRTFTFPGMRPLSFTADHTRVEVLGPPTGRSIRMQVDPIVVALMRSHVSKNQVFQAIVVLDAVDVVNDLCWLESTSEVEFHYPPVFHDPPAGVVQLPAQTDISFLVEVAAHVVHSTKRFPWGGDAS